MLPGNSPIVADNKPVPFGFEIGDTQIDATAKTVYTFSGMDFKKADKKRLAIVSFQAVTGSAGITVPSVLIGGLSANIQPTTSGDNRSGIAWVILPSGTTADVVITFSGGVSACSCHSYSIYALPSTTPVKSGSLSNNAAYTGDFVENEVVIEMANSRGTGIPAFIGTLGNSVQQTTEPLSGQYDSSGVYIVPADVTGATLQASNDYRGCYVSFLGG